MLQWKKKKASHTEHLAPTSGTFTIFFQVRQPNGRYRSGLVKFGYVTLV